LFERYVTSMARLCLRYLKDSDTAQDAMMEGFMKVFDQLKRFEYQGGYSLESWIRKIMVNECLMRLRKNRSRFFMDTAEVDIETSEKIDGNLSAEEITVLINQLPLGYRTVFNMYAIDGYTHAEIASLLGITESASRSQLTHARTKLKEWLHQHGWK
jgi:RNA polymerase sigma factor (sigma-70 family)